LVSINSGRRPHLEIVASILSTCRHWTKKTQVMSQCNMSSKQFTGYLDALLEANLLLIQNDRRSLLLRVSGKGKDFLKAYNSVITMLE
jgi:predicted transcriptional regulator